MSSVNYSLKTQRRSTYFSRRSVAERQERENEIKPKISFCGQGFFNNAEYDCNGEQQEETDVQRQYV